MEIAKYLHTFSLFFTFFLCSCTQQKETNVTLKAKQDLPISCNCIKTVE